MGGGVGRLNNPGWGKKTASVLMLSREYRRAFVGHWSRITDDPSSSSFQDWKVNAPSSTYSRQKREDGVPLEKYFSG